jgi:uncharacterized membrane protein YfcA
MDALLGSLLAAAILAAIVAFFYSNLGLGGGQLYVPIMDLFFVSLMMKEIVPISLCLAFATMASAAYSHSRKGLVDFKLGAFLAVGGLVGVGGGALFTIGAADQAVKAAFAAMLVIVATKMLYDLRKARKDYATCPTTFSLRCRLAGLGVSILTGFLIGSFGVGGGVVSVPLIIYVFKFEPRRAIGTSAFVGALLTPAAFAVYFLHESITIDFDIVAVLVPVVFVFALLGSRWGLAKLKTKMVKTIFTCGLYLAAAEMIYSLLLQ